MGGEIMKVSGSQTMLGLRDYKELSFSVLLATWQRVYATLVARTGCPRLDTQEEDPEIRKWVFIV